MGSMHDGVQQPPVQSVGIVIPVRNGGRYLAKTLDSVRDQTLDSWRLVIVVNDSSDNTSDIARHYVGIDGRITTITAPVAGVSRARNLGFEHLLANDSPDAVCFLDADDLWQPDALADLKEAVDADPAAVAAHGDATFVDADDAPLTGEAIAESAERLSRWCHDGSGKLRRLEAGEPTTQAALETWPCLLTPGYVMVRTAAIRSVGPWNTELSIGEDWELWVRLSRLGHIAHVPTRVIDYRVHAASANASSKRARGLARARHVIMNGGSEVDRRRIRRSFALARRMLAHRRFAAASEAASTFRFTSAVKEAAIGCAHLGLGWLRIV